MKSINLVKLASVLLLSASPLISFAKCHYGEIEITNVEGPYFGPVVCEQGEIPSLTVFGPARTHGTVIRGDVKVMGLFEGNQSETFGKFNVMGPLKLFDTTLHKDAQVATDYALVSHSHLEGLTIKSDTSADLHVEKNSVIRGSVTFDSKRRGKVHLESGSVIEGAVNNGDVIH
jgi:hypothetical protein